MCVHVCSLMFSFSFVSVYFHLHNHLSPNSPRLMFLFIYCATVNKVYLVKSCLISSRPYGTYVHYDDFYHVHKHIFENIGNI